MRSSTRSTTVRRLLALCCLCAAPFAGVACTGAESTADEAPTVPASDGSTGPSTSASSAEPDGSGTSANEPAVDAAAEKVATSFLEAYGAFDVEQAITYLSDDADISGLISSVGSLQDSVGSQDAAGSLKAFRLLVSFLEAEAYKQMLHSCEEVGSSASGTDLRCPFDFHAIRSDEIGLGPFSGSYFDLTVGDGEVVRASTTWDIGEFSPQMWEPFADWVFAAYPEDLKVMYTGGGTGVQLTEESIRLWEQRSREYADGARA